MRAARFMLARARVELEREEAGGGGGSLFSLPPFVCPPIAAGVVSCTFARCLTIDGSLIFARTGDPRRFPPPVAPPRGKPADKRFVSVARYKSGG